MRGLNPGVTILDKALPNHQPQLQGLVSQLSQYETLVKDQKLGYIFIADLFLINL